MATMTKQELVTIKVTPVTRTLLNVISAHTGEYQYELLERMARTKVQEVVPKTIDNILRDEQASQ